MIKLYHSPLSRSMRIYWLLEELGIPYELARRELTPPTGGPYAQDTPTGKFPTIEDGDVVMVPRGYHPTGAPHGYDLYYLNVMAGPDRHWIFRNDPTHDWIVRK